MKQNLKFNNFLNAASDEASISILYNIFMGRDPERNNPWLGVSRIELIKGLITSGEFLEKCKGIEESSFETMFLHRNLEIVKEIPAFLIEMGGPTPRSNTWPDFLLSGIEVAKKFIASDQLPDSIYSISEMIYHNYKANTTEIDFLKKIFRFDYEQILKLNRLAPSLHNLSVSETKALLPAMIINGEAEVSPFFQISGSKKHNLRRRIFGSIKKIDDYNIDDVMLQIRVAFEKGIVSHWLFDPVYYETQRERAFSSGRIDRWAPSSNPYMDFLKNGDRRNIRPHWLFCPIAYSIYNPQVLQKESLFSHYICFGQYEDLRTSALFDQKYYQAMHPTTRLDVTNGTYGSSLESFCVDLHVQNANFSPDFDYQFYRSFYPDVVPDGTHVSSIAHHFLFYGLDEGRNPNPYFDNEYVLLRYPWLKEHCQKLSISPLEYFLLIGRHENMKAARPLVDRSIDVLQAKALYERRAENSKNRSQRRPFDFTTVSDHSPVLSVIVPVHNQANFTARFLELAFYGASELKRRSGRTVEIIVVSNGSTDCTAELLASTTGIKYVDEAKALGYPEAANLGASIANGDLIAIVNNDIEFEPNVFADFVDSYYRIENCGAIGPRILSMDLTIQEIGSFLAGDGNSFGLSRGERSNYNSIEHIGRVDYVSGCFLCLSRADFEKLGGFDQSFSPGYYEEVDLCIRLDEILGKSTFVDSSISITHYEHASFTKGRPPNVSYATILRNRRRLLSKHPLLSRRPPINEVLGAAGLLRLGWKRSRVLIIEDFIPDSRLGSGFGRAAEVLRVFHKMGVAYDVVAVNPTMKVDNYEFSDTMLYRHWMPEESVSAVLNRAQGTYSHIWVCRSHNLARFYEALKLYKNVWNARIICDTEAVSVQRTVELSKLNGHALSDDEIADLVAAEFNTSSVVDSFVAVNERDANLLKAASLRNVSIISHTISGIARSNKLWKDRTRLLFVGSVHSPLAPNFDSVRWLLRGLSKNMPALKRKITLVGHWDEVILREFLDHSNCNDLDFVGMISENSLSELYNESVVALAPTRYSAGIPCKVVESMLTGIPIVMTELLADQIGADTQTRNKLAVAKIDADGEDFYRNICRLIDDEDWWKTVRDTQLSYAINNFGYDAFRQQIKLFLDNNDIIPSLVE